MVNPERLRLYLASLGIHPNWVVGFEDDAFAFAYHLVHFRSLIVDARRLWQFLIDRPSMDQQFFGFSSAMQRLRLRFMGRVSICQEASMRCKNSLIRGPTLIRIFTMPWLRLLQGQWKSRM